MPLVTHLQNPLTKGSEDSGQDRKPGRQSPDPETQWESQIGSSSSGHTCKTDTRALNQETLRKLPSNPVAPMDRMCDAKTRKPSAPLDGL